MCAGAQRLEFCADVGRGQAVHEPVYEGRIGNLTLAQRRLNGTEQVELEDAVVGQHAAFKGFGHSLRAPVHGRGGGVKGAQVNGGPPVASLSGSTAVGPCLEAGMTTSIGECGPAGHASGHRPGRKVNHRQHRSLLMMRQAQKITRTLGAISGVLRGQRFFKRVSASEPNHRMLAAQG